VSWWWDEFRCIMVLEVRDNVCLANALNGLLSVHAVSGIDVSASDMSEFET
jgi:hypothetical protein